MWIHELSLEQLWCNDLFFFSHLCMCPVPVAKGYSLTDLSWSRHYCRKRRHASIWHTVQLEHSSMLKKVFIIIFPHWANLRHFYMFWTWIQHCVSQPLALSTQCSSMVPSPCSTRQKSIPDLTLTWTRPRPYLTRCHCNWPGRASLQRVSAEVFFASLSNDQTCPQQ